MASPELVSMSSLPVSKGALAVIEDAFKNIFQGLGEKLNRIHTIVVVDTYLLPPFQIKLQGKLAPNPLLTSCLKKPTIPTGMQDQICLKAKNVAWILINCSHLEVANLGFAVSMTDFKYLKEYSSYTANFSNVRQLSLQVKIVIKEADRKTQWDLDADEVWEGGSLKTEIIIRLLQSSRVCLP